MITEHLPFQIKIVTQEQIIQVARVRSEAYGRHLPELGSALAKPEPADFEEGCVVVAATSRDGAILGTIRFHCNSKKPLPLQASIELPEKFQNAKLCEATRLSVLRSKYSSVVRDAIFKACTIFTLQQRIDWMLAAGRAPVDRLYDRMFFEDIYEANKYFPMAHAGGLPHRVMSLSPRTVDDLWRTRKQPLHEFFFKTNHPDIDVSCNHLF